MESFDVIVIGLGGMGSASAYRLASRGARVLGLEQYSPVHARGSSHGKLRLIRRAYFEDPRYVPLLNQSYDLWQELERRSGEKLFHSTGLLTLGGPVSGTLTAMMASAARYSIPLEECGTDELLRRFPQFRAPEGFQGLLEPHAGCLEVERCVRACLDQAGKAGAKLKFDEPVVSWKADSTGVTVRTGQGTYAAAKLVVAAGPWTNQLLADAGLPLVVRRVTQFWFPADERYLAETTPCFAFDFPGAFTYGFPVFGKDGLKLALHAPGEVVADPSQVDRIVRDSDLASLQKVVTSYLPGVSPHARASSVCLYTMTPDENFIVDNHPEWPHVCLAAGFSGHGFKFAVAVGDWLADLALSGKTAAPIAFLRRARFGRNG